MKAMKRDSSLSLTTSLSSSSLTTTVASSNVNLTELSLLRLRTTIRSEISSPESMRDTVEARETTTRTEIKLSLKATSPATTMALVTESCRGMMLSPLHKRRLMATSLATVEALTALLEAEAATLQVEEVATPSPEARGMKMAASTVAPRTTHLEVRLQACQARLATMGRWPTKKMVTGTSPLAS